MKHAILLLTLTGLTVVTVRHGVAQTVPEFQVSRPPLAETIYDPPAPYYVSEGLNGNEVYPPVPDAPPQRPLAPEPELDRAMDTSEACCGCGPATCACATSIRWEVDWLSMSRSGRRASHDIVGGRDAANFGDFESGPESGFRLRGAIGIGNWELAAAYADISPWTASSARELTTGVSFDQGINVSGAWLGQSFIDQTTLFSPIFAAASAATATDELDGFGPDDGGLFADAPPTLVTAYRSELNLFELNLMPRKRTGYGRRAWRGGIGYARATLDEFASASLSGSFRALDDGGGPFSGGLSPADLTDSAAGGLTLISGPGTGFDDATGGTQAPAPDTLTFRYAGAADNTLNGVQFLFDAVLLETCCWQLNTALKAGIFDNHARGSIRERYSEMSADGDVYGRDFTDDAHHVAFLGSVGVTGSYAVRDWLFFRGGYEVTFLSGVALASEQQVSNGAYRVDAESSLIAHGFTLGLEGRY